MASDGTKNINQPLVKLHLHSETELLAEDQECHLFLSEPLNRKFPTAKFNSN